MNARATSPVPFPVGRPEPSEGIAWSDYPRISPGEYFASCYWAKKYRDPGFKRWVCLLRWDVYTDDLQQRVVRSIPLWLALGDGEKPSASRRGKYLAEWVKANGGPPHKGDRLSPRIFIRRMARVEIGDTASLIPYSVVKRIIDWQTGPVGHSVNQSHSQGRQEKKLVMVRGYGA